MNTYKMYKKQLWEKMEKIFTNCDSFPRFFKEDIQLWYPLDDSNILSRLKGEKDAESIYEYLRFETKHELLKLFKEYRKYITNPSMNPRKPYYPLQYWVDPKEVTRKFDSQILDFLGEDTTHLFYVGEKGCGKTLTQNCWLYSKNKKLEERKIFWVRCDGYKLYNLWFHPDLKEEKATTLEDYLNMQLIYVFAKYYQDTPFFQKIFFKLRREKVIFSYMPGRSFAQQEDVEMAPYIEKFHRDIYGYERNRELDQKASYALYILQEAQARRTGIDRTRWNLLSLSRSFQDFLLRNDYKILKIVDGIDNINLLSLKAIPYYTHMISEIARFMFTSSTLKILKLVSLRERTKIDVIRARLELVDNLRDDIQPLTVKHTSPSFYDISKKRWEFIKKRIDLGDVQGPSDFLIYPFSRIYINVHNFQKINDCYHNNVATFLHNNFSLFMTIYYRWLQVNKTKDFSVERYWEIFRSRNFFLNGKFYLNSKMHLPDATKRGLFAFNIFYSRPNFSAKSLSRHWQGFCTTRILQYLNGVTYKVTEDQIIEFLGEKFGYTFDQINDSINLCRNFGLIDTKMSETEKEIYQEISKKGRYVLRLVYSDLDVLYTLALDTYLPIQFRSLIAVHSNKFQEETQYPSSAIITSFLFILFLCYIHKEEMARFNKKEANYYDLPFNWFQISKRALRLYNMAKSIEKSKVEKFVKELETLLSQP